MSYLEHPLSIKAWAAEDRPREKLLKGGPKALTQAELLAIIIRSGTKRKSAVQLSKDILSSFNNNLSNLARSSAAELMKFDGIAEAKAISILASLELGNRKQFSNTQSSPKITSSYDAYECLAATMIDLNHEVFTILLLNRQNKLIKLHQLSSGGVSGTYVDPKMIFKQAIDHLASGVILCHNHPSGNLKPSEADIVLTRKLKESGKMMDINILDHLIIAEKQYFSFLDEGIL